jgi:hypothetical protein
MPFAFVQGRINPAAGSNPYTLAFNGPVQAGNTIVAVIHWVGITGSVVSVSDNLNGAGGYVPGGPIGQGTSYSLQPFYLNNTKGGIPTVSFQLSATQTAYIDLYEFSGPVVFVDGYATNNGTGTGAFSAGNIITTVASDLLIAVARANSISAYPPGAINQSFGGFGSSYWFPGSAGLWSMPFSQSGTSAWISFILALSPDPAPSVKFVQSPTPLSQTAQNPTMAFGGNVTSGDLLVLFFEWANTNGAVSSVIDNLGNAWQQMDFQQVAGTLRTTYCFAAIAKQSGPCTVTINTDSSRTYTSGLYEFSGASLSLDGTPVHTSSGTSITNPATGTLTTVNPGSIVLAQTKAGTISTNPGSPWVPQSVTNHGTAYQIPGVAGPFSASWTVASSAYATTILAFLPFVPPPPSSGKVNPTTFMRLLAQQNKVLGGPGAKTSDNEFTLIAKNNVLLGGQLATPADTVFSMLSRQNKLLGGPGARAGDSVFSLYCRNLKLLGGSPNTNDNVITLLTKINNLIHHP